MSDLALYRSVASIPGSLAARFVDDGDEWLEISLDRPVETVLGVTANGSNLSDILIVGKQRLRAKVPPPVRSIPNISLRIHVAAEIPFEQWGTLQIPSIIGIGPRPAISSDVLTALQSALRSLLMSPGSDYDHPSRGGGALRLIRDTMADLPELTRKLTIAVDKTNAYLTRARTRGVTSVSRIELRDVRKISATEFDAFRDLPGDGTLRRRLETAAAAGAVISSSFRMVVRSSSGSPQEFSTAVLR